MEFYFAGGIADANDLDAVKAAATAAVKTVASIEEPPPPPARRPWRTSPRTRYRAPRRSRCSSPTSRPTPRHPGAGISTNDGTVDSTAQNPSHTYTAAGTYTVKLTASNGAGSDEEVKTDYVTVTAPTMDVLYDGTVVLTPGATFDKTAYNSGTSYTISRTTPLGALDAAGLRAGSPATLPTRTTARPARCCWTTLEATCT